jgi:predicted DNA-binding transcriptional regulator AlpA
VQHQTYVTDLMLAKRYAVNRSTIWRWTQSGLLLRPVQLSAGCTRWRSMKLNGGTPTLQQPVCDPGVCARSTSKASIQPQISYPGRNDVDSFLLKISHHRDGGMCAKALV